MNKDKQGENCVAPESGQEVLPPAAVVVPDQKANSVPSSRRWKRKTSKKCNENLQIVMHRERWGEEFRKMTHEKKCLFLAQLAGMYTINEIANVIGISAIWVKKCIRGYEDVREAVSVTRKMAIAEMCERKAFRLVQAIDPDQVPQEKLARATRDLMETATVASDARRQIEQPDKESDVQELIFRVKRYKSQGGIIDMEPQNEPEPSEEESPADHQVQQEDNSE